MAQGNNQKPTNSTPANTVNSKTSRKNRAESQTINSSIRSALKLAGSRLYDLIGSFAALFTIIDMCFVWYRAFYFGGTTIFYDTLIILQLELLIIGPLALSWILAKFRGWL